MSPLARVARVVAPDMPGFGFTEVPDGYDYTFKNMGQTIDAFTEAVGIERCFLYVHDSGRRWPIISRYPSRPCSGTDNPERQRA